MKLYKAIKYDGHSVLKMSSKLMTTNKNIFDWESLICQAISHISHGDRKKKNDCWISATYNYKTVCDYLDDEKYDFNGIAVIDLPNTSVTGYIYDYTLREFGYIDKDLIKGQLLSNSNEDGILVTLDMSSDFTWYYLGSCLWLKGNTNSLGNFRASRNAHKYNEVLILGEDIPFTFIKKEDVHHEFLDSCQPENYYGRVFEHIIKNLTNREIVEKLFPISQIFFHSLDDELNDYIEFKKNICREIALERDSYWGDEFLLIDEENIKKRFVEEIKNKNFNILLQYYANITYKYLSNKEHNRFYEYYKLSYADKDVIDFEKYEIVQKYKDIEVDYFIAAYVYAGVYMNFKDTSSTTNKLWKYINGLFSNKYIAGTVDIEDFMRDYNIGYGVYQNWNKN